MELSMEAHLAPCPLRPLLVMPGAVAELVEDPAHACAVVVRALASVRSRAPCVALWWQLRGCTRIQASEWMVFDPESLQDLQALPGGLTAGLLLPQRANDCYHGLLPGSGRAELPDLRIALQLWRRYAWSPQHDAHPGSSLRPLLLHLQYMQRNDQRLIDNCPGRTFARRRQVLVRMQRVRMLLEGNLHRSVSLAEAAQLGCFSEWWVSKAYRAIYGETVQQATIRLRMQHARSLLQTTSLSIAEIGEACGFQDPCSFARQFKRTHGMTATRWRDHCQARRQTRSIQAPRPAYAIEHIAP
jgi:AraC family transcriptional regulator